MTHFLKGFYAGFSKFMSWVCDTKLIGPITSGDILQCSVFALCATQMYRGEPSWLLLFLAAFFYVVMRGYEYLYYDLRLTTDVARDQITQAIFVIESQSETIRELQKQLVEKSHESTGGVQ